MRLSRMYLIFYSSLRDRFSSYPYPSWKIRWNHLLRFLSTISPRSNRDSVNTFPLWFWLIYTLWDLFWMCCRIWMQVIDMLKDWLTIVLPNVSILMRFYKYTVSRYSDWRTMTWSWSSLAITSIWSVYSMSCGWSIRTWDPSKGSLNPFHTSWFPRVGSLHPIYRLIRTSSPHYFVPNPLWIKKNVDPLYSSVSLSDSVRLYLNTLFRLTPSSKMRLLFHSICGFPSSGLSDYIRSSLRESWKYSENNRYIILNTIPILITITCC